MNTTNLSQIIDSHQGSDDDLARSLGKEAAKDWASAPTVSREDIENAATQGAANAIRKHRAEQSK